MFRTSLSRMLLTMLLCLFSTIYKCILKDDQDKGLEKFLEMFVEIIPSDSTSDFKVASSSCSLAMFAWASARAARMESRCAASFTRASSSARC